MRFRRIVPILLVVALAACKKSEGGKGDLPPATGEGAAPLPEIPALTAASDAGAEASASASATETTGTLQARAEVKVGPKASGTIKEIKVDEGSKVKKGDVLFRLDSGDAALMKRAAETQLRGAKLALKTAEREYKRIQGLVAQNAASQQQVDQLEAQVEGAQVQIATAQNSIAMANKAIADATVRSPITGVVLTKLMSVGEYANLMGGGPVLVLQDQSSLELKFRLPERSLATIKKGDAVEVAIPALGTTRKATIGEISPMVDPRTRTIELTAVLDNADGTLKPGMMAEVKLGAVAAEPAPVPTKEPPAKEPPATQPPAPPEPTKAVTP